jgi:hypothetical protein
MSDDLLDQIASRFGRDALDLNGDYYYHRRNESSAAAAASWNDLATGISFQQTTANIGMTETFRRQIDEYMRKSMGNQDVYCCPICYIVAHQRFQGGNDQKKTKKKKTKNRDDIARQYPTDFAFDPMTILGYPDNDRLKIAATFCYKKVAQLKQHLREDHGVNTKQVKGNDLYERYKVRAKISLDC